MFTTHSTYRYKRSKPQSEESITLPNQTVDLSILVKQLMQGQSLNVGLSLESPTDATLDSPDLRLIDLKHLTLSQVDSMLPKEQNVPTPVDDTTPLSE